MPFCESTPLFSSQLSSQIAEHKQQHNNSTDVCNIMATAHDRKYFLVWKIFRTDMNGHDDLVAENCLIHIDSFYVLGVFSMEEATADSTPHLYFPLNNATTITFKKFRSSSGKYAIGQMVLEGIFSTQPEKITIKMDLPNYNALVETSQSWP